MQTPSSGAISFSQIRGTLELSGALSMDKARKVGLPLDFRNSSVKVSEFHHVYKSRNSRRYRDSYYKISQVLSDKKFKGITWFDFVFWGHDKPKDFVWVELGGRVSGNAIKIAPIPNYKIANLRGEYLMRGDIGTDSVKFYNDLINRKNHILVYMK